MKKYWVDDDGYIIYGDDNEQVIVCEMYPEHVQALTKIIESGTPPNPQHGRKPDKVKPECDNCVYLEADGEIINEHIEKIMRLEARLEEPENVKPLAQYLGEYIEHECGMVDVFTTSGAVSWRELLEQALDAYESTEQVKIRIERV